MNRQQWKERLPLIEAYVNGETIQRIASSERWVDLPETDFSSPISEYRIKPKPREWWINVYRTNEKYVHPTKESADATSVDGDRIDCIHVREVVE